jgi:hypothetical protein
MDNISFSVARFYVTGVGVPLLTFAGFLAVYLGFLSQREQNDLQREQTETQRANFQRDRFESTFFQLLRTQNQITSSLGQGTSRFSLEGKGYIKILYNNFESDFETKSKKNDWGDTECSQKHIVRSTYTKWFSNRKSELNHYFNHLSKIICFVQRKGPKDKHFYIDLVASQMSVPELKLFFYHVNLMKDETNHRDLRTAHDVVGEYAFFSRLDHKSLAHEQHYYLNKRALGVK